MPHSFFGSRLSLLALLLLLVVASETADACSRAHDVAPHGRLIHQSLTSCQKGTLLQSANQPALYAVAARDGEYHPTRQPVLLVHGLSGHPSDLKEFAAQLTAADYQVYVLFFDDMGQRIVENGAGFAREIQSLLTTKLAATESLTLIAHSAGGLITRHALNLLAASGDLGRLRSVNFYAVDTPWHGYFGPSDRTALGRLRMTIARPFLPNGIEDLRAESELFLGDPASSHSVLRTGLLRYALPPNVRIHLYFAQSGEEVADYTEDFLASLANQVAAYYQTSMPLSGEPRLTNFWHALIASHSYFTFQEELRRLASHGQLNSVAVRSALLRYFPRLPGDHTGVLSAQSQGGEPSLVALLMQAIAAQPTAA